MRSRYRLQIIFSVLYFYKTTCQKSIIWKEKNPLLSGFWTIFYETVTKNELSTWFSLLTWTMMLFNLTVIPPMSKNVILCWWYMICVSWLSKPFIMITPWTRSILEFTWDCKRITGRFASFNSAFTSPTCFGSIAGLSTWTSKS